MANANDHRPPEGSMAPLGAAPALGAVRSAIMGELRARLFGHHRPKVGRYSLMEIIGEGSFGAVYRALDPQLEREVAIKLLRHAEPDALLVEAQRAARLAHPNIVPIHDVGLLESGGAFLVMDLVEGPTLRGWLETSRSPREILALLIAAGRGLAAAHEAGLVHRDFKPANILVTPEEGRPMVADFGLATPSAHERGGETLDDSASTSLHTSIPLVGTPRYMAPELFVGQPADERSDQYAYCLTLREALTGTIVFDSADIDDQVPRKRAPLPRWPKGCPVPRRWRPIIDRGLAADPDERWPSMHGLLLALQRATRRHRGIQLAAGCALGSVLASAWALQAERSPCESAPYATDADVLWTHADATRVRQHIERRRPAALDHAWTRLDRALGERSAAWSAAMADNCRATFVDHEQDKADLAARTSCLDQLEAEITSTIDVLASADFDELGRAVDLVVALPNPGQCGDPASLAPRYASPEPQTQAEPIAQQRRALGEARVLRRVGRLSEAERVAREALGEAEAIGFVPLVPEARVELGIALYQQADYPEAEEQLRHTLDEALAADLPAIAVAAASSLSLLVDEAQAHIDEALSLATIARSLSRRPEVSTEIRANTLHNHGIILRHADRLAESEAVHRQSLAMRTRAVDILSSQEALAVVLADQRRLGEASALMEETLAQQEHLLGPQHPNVVATRLNLGWVAHEQGDVVQAIAHFEGALAGATAAYGPHHPTISAARANLGASLAHAGDYEGALQQTREALELDRALHGERHPDYATTLGNLGYLQHEAGQPQQARRSLERALQLEGCNEPQASMRCVATLSNLAQVASSLGDDQEAEVHWRRAIALTERSEQARVRAIKPLTGLGRFLLQNDQISSAIALLEQAAQLGREHDTSPALRAPVQLELALAHAARGDEALAREQALAAATLFARAGPRFDEQQEEARALAQRLGDEHAS